MASFSFGFKVNEPSASAPSSSFSFNFSAGASSKEGEIPNPEVAEAVDGSPEDLQPPPPARILGLDTNREEGVDTSFPSTKIVVPLKGREVDFLVVDPERIDISPELELVLAGDGRRGATDLVRTNSPVDSTIIVFFCNYFYWRLRVRVSTVVLKWVRYPASTREGFEFGKHPLTLSSTWLLTEKYCG